MHFLKDDPFRRVQRFLFLGSVSAWSVALSAQGVSNGPALGLSTGGDDVNWQEVAQAYHSAFVAPTPPVPVEGMVLPWEPTEAVVIALPLADWNRQPGVAKCFREILVALLPKVKVVALYREIDYRLIGDWLMAMENDPAIAPHLSRLEWVASEAFSIWARDFSPLYARGQDGTLVGIDTSFLATRRMMGLLQAANSQMDPVEQQYALREASAELKGMRGADAVASVLMPFIETRLEQATALVRAPVYLLGGDILLVDREHALVSAQTLQENGGRTQTVKAALRDYGHIEDVLFLENLPGDTIEHLDFIVQPIAEQTILVAAPPPSFAGDRPYHQYLEKELKGRFARNRAKVATAFPDARIFELPMLPPLLDDESAILDELFRHCVKTVASQRGLPFWFDPESPDPLNLDAMDARLVSALRSELGVMNWNAPILRRRAIEQFLQRPFKELLQRHVEAHVRYRSYVNSLYLKTADGSELVLVPHYEAAFPEEAPVIAEMESRVVKIFKEALPGAVLHWIDCTALTEHLGAVHCLTSTIPDPATLGIKGTAE